MLDTPEEALSLELIGKSPFDLGCALCETPSGHGDGFWFQHPLYTDVVAKIGPNPEGKMLRIWGKVGTPFVILDADWATEEELRKIAQLN